MRSPFLMLAFSTAFLTALTAADVRLPKYTREELPNGTVVYLMPKPGVPLVSVQIEIKGGQEAEPASQAGLAAVTAALLRKGTTNHSADQFSAELDGLGGTFRASRDEQSTTIASEFLKKDFEQGLNLTADAILHPVFPEAEVKKFIGQAIDGVKATKDNPQAAIRLYARAFFFGPDHPYGRTEDEATLAKISRESIVEFHKRYYTGKNIIVVVTGDFDPAVAHGTVAKIFGSAPAGEAYQWQTRPAVSVAAPRLLLIDKPDATQTYFWIAQPGISRTEPGRTTLELANTLFGGRFTSLLNDALRVNSGLTYGAGSTLEEDRLPGTLTIATYTRTDTTEKAMDMALDVLKKFNENGMTATQLASIKAYVKGTFPTRHLETSDQLANELGEMEIFGLNRGEVDDLFSRIDSVTLEQANAAVKQHFRPEKLTFVVLGNASKIRDLMKKYAPSVTEVSIKDPGFGK